MRPLTLDSMLRKHKPVEYWYERAAHPLVEIDGVKYVLYPVHPDFVQAVRERIEKKAA